jgi:competence protein ComEC
LPFFLAGLALGPRLIPFARPLFIAALISALVLGVRTAWKKAPGWVWAGLVFFLLGLALAAQAFRPPQDPWHVYHQVDRPRVFGGYLAEPAAVTFGRTRLVVDVKEVMETGGPSSPAAGRIQVTVPEEVPGLGAGDYLRFPTRLERFHRYGNPGAFDYPQYQAARGVWAGGYVKSARLVAVIRPPEAGWSFRSSLDQVRRRARHFIEQSTSPPVRGFLLAMLIGVRGQLENPWEDLFRRLGLSHLLSISGLHVGLAALAAYLLFYRTLQWVPRLALRWDLDRAASALALGPVWFYAALAGGETPTVRSAVMVTVFLLARLISRKKDPLTALAAAAWLILLPRPGAVFEASFQLSFSAVAAILILGPRFPGSPFRGPAKGGDPPDPAPAHRWLWGLTIVSACALIGTTPIAAYHFQRLPLLSLPANLVFTSIISMVVVPPGLLALALAGFWPAAGGWLLGLMEKVLWLVLPGVEMMAWEPSELLVSRPGPVFLTVYYLAWGLVVIQWPRRKKVLALGSLLALGALAAWAPTWWTPAGRDLNVTVVDVGQGQAVHVRFPDGTEAMVDGGGFAGSDFDVGENILAPYLLARGITRLDFIAFSHPQIDHLGGLLFLARRFGPRELWTNQAQGRSRSYENLRTVARRRGITQPPLKNLHQGRTYGMAAIRALYPEPDDPASAVPGSTRDENNRCLVLKLTLGRRAILLPGDLEAEGEADVVRIHGPALKADVLVAPHHGSRNSMTPEFLAAVQPEVVIFSAGRNNRFGFPSDEAQTRARNAGARVYRTDRDGAVEVTTDGERLDMKTWGER